MLLIWLERTDNMVEKGLLSGDKIIVSDKRFRDQLIQKAFGEQKEGKLVLDLFEATYLLEKGKIEIEDADGKKFDAVELEKFASKKYKDFHSRLVVFRDLRDKGYVVKTGFKFGFDFRIYPHGKRPGEEHTKWVVAVATQGEKFAMPELSRMIRLSGNLKTECLQAVVDSEDDICYYKMERVTP